MPTKISLFVYKCMCDVFSECTVCVYCKYMYYTYIVACVCVCVYVCSNVLIYIHLLLSQSCGVLVALCMYSTTTATTCSFTVMRVHALATLAILHTMSASVYCFSYYVLCRKHMH